MNTRYSKVLQWFFSRIFDRIDYPQQSAEEINSYAQDGVVVYVARAPSAWLYLYLNHALRKLGLPLAQHVAGISFILWQPVSRLWKFWIGRREIPGGPWRRRYIDRDPSAEEAHYADAVMKGQTSFLMLHPRRGPKKKRKRSPNNFVQALVAVQRVIDKPIYILPHVLTDRAFSGMPNSGLTDRIFGHRRDPGTLRELAIRVSTLKTATVRTAEALNLKEFIDSHADIEDLKLARKVSHEINRRLNEEERVIAGPDIPQYEAMARHVLRTPEVRELIKEEAADQGKSETYIEKKADTYVQEIAARYQVGILKLVETCVAILFNRIYDGLVFDAEGFQRVQEAARRGPLMFCPCHRSHVDYLALSHTLWRKGMVPPHIAAGINLSFFPMGYIFRRCGAFFLRRSFKKDRLYGGIFRAYIYELIRTGISIEFFLEGTRTRTGKLLMPRYGLLGMVVDAWRDGVRPDVQFIPVSIDYEKIIEAASYERELKGGAKKKEDLGALLQTAGVLRSKFGRLHLQFGDPISLADFAASENLPQSRTDEDDELWRRGTQRLGFRILHNISKACTVTPTTVVAAVLLSHQGRGLSQTKLLENSRAILEYLDDALARFSAPLRHPKTRDAAVLEAIEQLIDDDTVAVQRAGRIDSEPIYYVEEDKRVLLDFPKNSAINHFAPGAIIARALTRTDQTAVPYNRVRDETRYLSQLFKKEFIFRGDADFEQVFDETLATLVVRGYVNITDAGEVEVLNRDKLTMLSGFLDSFIEAYWTVAHSLRHLQRFPLWSEELKTRALEGTHGAFLEGKISRKEAANKTLISSALQWMEQSGYIKSTTRDKRTEFSLSDDFSEDQLNHLIEQIELFL